MIDVRRTGAVSAATLCVLALTLVLAHLLAPHWTRNHGLDFWNYPSAIALDNDSRRNAEVLSAQQQRLLVEIELSDRIATQLAEGSVSLDQAVAEVEPILRERSGFEHTARNYYGTASLRQTVARYLLARIAMILVDDECERECVLYRLETEYRQMN